MKTMSSQISKSLVMKSAWAIVKRNGMTLAEALKKAWAALKAKALMASHKVRIQFIKNDGSLREALATLDLNNYHYESKGSGRVHNYGNICYYDLEKKGFRSFCINNFVGVIGLAD